MSKASIEKDAFIAEMVRDGTISTDPLTGDVYSHWTARRSSKSVRLAGRVSSHGYVQYNLGRNGHHARLAGHRIIWIASNGMIPEELEIDHINRIRHDNRLCNLRLVTYSENAQNSDRIQGERHMSSKLSNEDVIRIREQYSLGGCYCADLAKEYGVYPTTIERIVSGKNWKSLPIMAKTRASPRSKLTSAQVHEIRDRKDVKLVDFVKKYNISISYASQIRSGVRL